MNRVPFRNYDQSELIIRLHLGDAERRKVWALRIGEKMVLKYNWWHNSKPIGDLFEVELNSGDGYIMSEKAVGYDWLKKKIYTLRHSAGSTKYVSINK